MRDLLIPLVGVLVTCGLLCAVTLLLMYAPLGVALAGIALIGVGLSGTALALTRRGGGR